MTALYDHILGHDPDRAGLSHWSGRPRAGASHRAVERAIWDSPEHRVSQHKDLTPGISFARAYRLAMQAETMAETHAAARARSHKS